MNVEEYDVKVPWGHIAVKAWGNVNDVPVLVTHGIQDNAGIFDRIVPLLPHCFYYMCIDFPGHGKSSPYPTQMFINPMDGVLVIKLLLDHFDRKKYVLLGHSWGAHAAFMFSQIYPEYVSKLCLIDGLFPFSVPAEVYKDYWKTRIDGLIKINKNVINNVLPTYTYEEAMDKIINNRLFGGLTHPTAKCLLKRCLRRIEQGKYVFTTDPRLRVFLLSDRDDNYVVDVLKKHPIKCPVLLIKATLSQKIIWSKFSLVIKELENYPNWNIQDVEGNHDDFSNKAEAWADVISQFLCTDNSKL